MMSSHDLIAGGPDTPRPGLVLPCSGEAEGRAELATSITNRDIIPGYKLLSLAGIGGSAAVWKARWLETDQVVAVKLVTLEGGSATHRRRFLEEIKVATALDHPHLVSVIESGSTDNFLFYSMEFIDGRTLTEYVQENSLTHTEIVELFKTICEAVSHAHGSGIIHRDLKPANVLIDNDGSPHILDFGLARRDLRESTQMTATAELVGTVAYMSPEQARGDCRAAAATDIYALGVMLYEAVTGRLPYDTSGMLVDVLTQIIDGRLLPFGRDHSEMIDGLAPIILKCLSYDPRCRYHTVAELRADLNRVAHRQPIRFKPTPILIRLSGRLQAIKRRRLSVSAAGVAILIVLACSLILIQRHRLLESAERSRAADAMDTVHLTLASQAVRDGSSEDSRRHLSDLTEQSRGWYWRHLAAQSHSLQLTGSVPAPFRAIGLTGDGSELLVHQSGEALTAWNLLTGRRTDRWPDLVGYTRSLSVTPRQSEVMGTTDDGRLVRWRFRAGTTQTLGPVGEKWPSDLICNPHNDQLVAYQQSPQTVVTAELTGGSVQRTTLQSASVISTAAWYDQNILITGGVRLGVWDARTGQLLAETPDLSEQITRIAVNHPSGSIAAGSTKGLVHIWHDGLLLGHREIRRHTSRIAQIAWMGGHLLSVDMEGIAYRWDGETGKLLEKPRPHHGPVHFLASSNKIKCFVATDSGGGVALWPVPGPASLELLDQGTPITASLRTFGADASVAWVTAQGDITVISLGEDLTILDQLSESPVALVDHEILPNREPRVAVSDARTSVTVYGPDQAYVLSLPKEPEVRLVAIQLNRYGDQIAASTTDDRILVSDMTKRAFTTALAATGPYLWTPNAQALVTTSAEEPGVLSKVKIDDGSISEILRLPDGEISALTWSPDKAVLLIGTDQGDLYRWSGQDSDDPQLLTHLDGGGIFAIAINRHGDLAVLNETSLQVGDHSGAMPFRKLDGLVSTARPEITFGHDGAHLHAITLEGVFTWCAHPSRECTLRTQ